LTPIKTNTAHTAETHLICRRIASNSSNNAPSRAGNSHSTAGHRVRPVHRMAMAEPGDTLMQ